ncbi:hypothetical protein AX17_004901 [Amanita inopinata Kibby_2008]|nr:hypothetical protein AX17_004901 [Amanita inopinata Kibby_2008]
MEEENEVLDWGNEDDEQHQDLHRRAPFADVDADDAVSLGEDEDEHAYYAQQPQENANSSVLSTRNGKELVSDSVDTLGSAFSSDMNLDQPSGSRHEYRRDERSEAQGSSAIQRQSSSQTDSPSRSQPLLQPRLTHALPPKPVAASLPYISPSHPSIVEATAMSVRARDHKKTNGQTGRSSHGDDQLPPNWEIRYPRSGGQDLYYYNVVTHQSTWTRPVSNIDSPLIESRGTRARRRRGSSVSAGDIVSLPNSLGSDEFNSQSIRSSRAPQSTVDASKQPQHAGSVGSSALSYEDRHYRPSDPPDVRRADRIGDASDSRLLEHEHTPPNSPHPRQRARSASPVSLIQRQPSVELRDRSGRSTRGAQRQVYPNLDTDIKGDASDLSRSRDIPVTDNSAPRWADVPRGAHDTIGVTNRETRHPQFGSAVLAESAGPANEDRDRPLLSRNHSSRGRNREREHPRNVEARREHNQNISLSAPRHRSPPPHRDREWIPAQREQEHVQQSSASTASNIETTPRAMPVSSGPRQRDRPSRFDQPVSTAVKAAPPAIVTAPSTTTVRPNLRPREHDIYIPDESNVPQRWPAERDLDHERDELMMPSSQQVLLGGNDVARDTHANDRAHRADHLVDRQRASDLEETSSASGQQGPASRRKRAPLPPQATSYREGTARRMDHEPAGPSTPQGALSFLPGSKEQQRPTLASPNAPPFAPRHAAPRPRTDSDIIHRGRQSFSGLQYSGNTRRDKSPSEKRDGLLNEYPQRHSHPPIESPMDVDVNSLSSTSSRFPPASTPDKSAGVELHIMENVVENPAMRGPKTMESRMAVRETGGIGPSVPGQDVSSTSYQAGETRMDITKAATSEHQSTPANEPRLFESRQEHEMRKENALRIQRAIFDGTDRHVSRRDIRRPNEYTRPGSTGPAPKLSGPNTVSISDRRAGSNTDSVPPTVLESRFGDTAVSGSPRQEIGSVSQEPPRNVKVLPPLPPGKQSYERPIQDEKATDSYRQAQQDVPGSNQRRRRNSPQPYNREYPPEQAKIMTEDVTRGGRREFQPRERFRFDQPVTQDSRAPRAWEGKTRDLHPRTIYPVEDDRPPTPPPPSRESSMTSPTWDSSDGGNQFLSRHPVSQQPPQRRRSGVPQEFQVAPPMDDRGHAYPEPPRRRESDARFDGHYDERSLETPKQSHPPPPNPVTTHNRESHSPQDRRQSRPDRSRQADVPASNVAPPAERRSRWGESLQDAASSNAAGRPEERGRRAGPVDRYKPDYGDGFPGEPNRVRRPPPTLLTKKDGHVREESTYPTDVPPGGGQQRDHERGIPRSQYPANSRRLLDRLSLDTPNNPVPVNEPPPQSLRDRVQIPEKRDRDDMNHEYLMDTSYEVEAGIGTSEPAMKRVRRRSGKARRGRRGGAVA